MSSGEQLAQWCKDHDVVGFNGVHCSDGLPIIWRPRDVCYIINHSRCGFGNGTHWLACRQKGDSATWWDSYGVPPHAVVEQEVMTPGMKPPEFIKWLQECGVDTDTKLKYSSEDIQSVASTVCGQYAVYFLKHGTPAANPKAWRWLSSSVLENDKQIKALVRLQSNN